MSDHGLDIPKAFQRIDRTRARYKAAYGGRGTAKSHTFAAMAVIRAASKPVRVLCCREIQRSIRESVKATIEQKIVAARLQHHFHSTQNEITSRAGAQFLFEGLHNNVTRIQSLEAIDVAWVDEAQSISQRSLDILLPTIRKPQSELWFSWNPYRPRDPVDAMFRGAGAGVEPDRAIWQGQYDTWQIVQQIVQGDNPYFPEVLSAEMDRDKRRDPDKYRHIWLGHYASISNAAVFRNWRVDDGTFELPKGLRPYYGADWGFAVDPTVLVRCYRLPEQRILYIDAEVGGVGIDIDKTPAFFDTIEATEDHHPRKWPIMADSSRPETISYMQRHGYANIERARKGTGSVEEGVEFLKAHDIIINPNCKRVIDEFTNYRYEIDNHTEEVLPKLADEHNHTIDAVRYAVEKVRRGYEMSDAFPELLSVAMPFPGDHPGY